MYSILLQILYIFYIHFYLISGLPNHCKLEVVPCKETSAQKVKIALQLEEGGRVIGEYTSEDCLDGIYEKAREKLNGTGNENGQEPVIIYMRQEFVGTESFSKTKLRQLGLTGGSAVLRLIHRKPEALNEQANVYNIKEKVKNEEEKSKNWRPMRNEDQEASLKMFENLKKETEPEKRENTEMEVEIEPEKIVPKKEEKPVNMEEIEEKSEEKIHLEEKLIEEIKEDPIINILDEENQLIIYKLTDRSAKIRNIIDVSDDFFDLTLEDAKNLLKDVRKMQKDLEPDEKILMTKEMRKTQEEGAKLALLNKYKHSIIRIQLPNRHVIQGIFKPGTEVKRVLEKIGNFLTQSENLTLFITPPKTVLDPGSNLLDCGLVPAALVYLSCENSVEIKENVQLSNSTGAEEMLSRIHGTSDKVNLDHIVSAESSASLSNNSAPVNATAIKRPPIQNLSESGSKVPKWFKSGK